MSAGKLNRRATIKALQSGQDEIGQPVTTWSTVATVWADIRHLSGLEQIKGDADASIVKASIRIRRRSDVNAGMRAYEGATAYEIKAVLDDDKRIYLNLACERVS